MKEETKVNIRPGISILSVLKHLNYKPHFALSEFVDNAIDSYQKNKRQLRDLDSNFRLVVKIEFNTLDNEITISDNAGGIHKDDMDRAFRTAEVPPDASGLSEFGMGMKSAACWFSSVWEVRTKHYNEVVERKIEFDINKIVDDKIEELIINETYKKDGHYTVVRLKTLHNKLPQKRAVKKIKDHLTSIYRDFIRKEELDLYYNGALLSYEEPKILESPYYSNRYIPVGDSVLWKKPIDFDLEEGLSVTGFVGILDKGSIAGAGLSLFRRRRVILGSADEGYKPKDIFLTGNSFASQRLFGELHLTGFEVTHTKDGFREGENMQIFIDLLREDLSSGETPYLKQVQNYRRTPSSKEQSRKFGKVLKSTVTEVHEDLPSAVEEISNRHPVEDSFKDLPEVVEKNYEEITIRFNGQSWLIAIELSYDDSYENLIDVGDSYIKSTQLIETDLHRKVGIRISMKHPFMVEYGIFKQDALPGLLRLVAAIGLSEVVAKSSGVRFSNTFRRNINDLLKTALL